MRATASTPTPTPYFSIMPPSELENVRRFTDSKYRKNHSSTPRKASHDISELTEVTVIGSSKGRMENFSDTIKLRPPPDSMYHAAKSFRVPNDNIAGADIKWTDVFRRAALREAARQKDDDAATTTSMPPTSSPSQLSTYPSDESTHPPPHSHARDYPSSPLPLARMIEPIPQSLHPDPHLSNFKTPRTPYTHIPILDTSSYTTSSSSHTAKSKYLLSPPTNTDVGNRAYGYRFVDGSGDPGTTEKSKRGGRGVKFESEVEVRTFGKDEEARRVVRGHEEIWIWMEGKVDQDKV